MDCEKLAAFAGYRAFADGNLCAGDYGWRGLSAESLSWTGSHRVREAAPWLRQAREMAMKNVASVFLALGWLVAATAISQAQTGDTITTPAITQNANPTTADGLPAPQTMPATEGAPVSSVLPVAVQPGCGDGTACGEHRSCLAQFWAWLTYEPLNRTGACSCCQGCYPCCNPPLYAYFPCAGCNGGCAHGNCASGACAGASCASTGNCGTTSCTNECAAGAGATECGQHAGVLSRISSCWHRDQPTCVGCVRSWFGGE